MARPSGPKGMHAKQGRMRRKRNTISKVTLLAVTCCVLAPSAATAGSLLSGYGGPGQGSQELLGSTLLNGPGGGSGGGGASPRGSGSTGRSPSAGAARPARRQPTRGASRRHAAGGSETASANSFQRHSALPAQPISQTGSVASQTLGLSSDDLVYIFLALGALAVTGALTGHLARRPRQGS